MTLQARVLVVLGFNTGYADILRGFSLSVQTRANKIFRFGHDRVRGDSFPFVV